MVSVPIIEVKHLYKSFDNQTALKNLDFSIQAGEIFGFLGPSGAGKTTTIKILTGQLVASSGTATVLGNNSQHLKENIYEHIGVVTHDSGLYENLSAYDNLITFARIFKVNKSMVDTLLRRVNLHNDKKKLVKKFSQGMKQRLILARAILNHPQILFLDEPTNGIDPGTTQEIHQLILELRDSGTTVFLTTHNMNEAAKLCDRVALLNDGKIAEIGSPQALSLKYNKKIQYKILLKNNTAMKLIDSEETRGKINWWMENEELQTIHSCEPTLEDVFLEVTGRNLK
ncbi:ABC transporter ATP-binding protein [Companilactobacillus sp. HBUAS56275]|uniref:ABC transporter ATP-binding protein n=1 Tax=Candidatus Companilactobacillus pullicola TaxID=2838523 RepID=A0A9D1ZLV0_9LACO|nr:ABC transporter ATP-binding protein [Candidatus Companilactobacillus pullicola]